MKGGCAMCEGCDMRGDMCGQHHWMHIIIKILVALFIFWCGVQFGELKSLLHPEYSNRGYGYGMMGLYNNEGIGQTYFYGTPTMMSGWTRSAASQSSTSTVKK